MRITGFLLCLNDFKAYANIKRSLQEFQKISKHLSDKSTNSMLSANQYKCQPDGLIHSEEIKLSKDQMQSENP